MRNKFFKVLKECVKDVDKDITYEGFIKKIKEAYFPEEEEKIVEAKEIFESVVINYPKKRRGGDVAESFVKLNEMFRESVKTLLSSDACFENYVHQPFLSELFDKHTDYKYVVHVQEDVYEAQNLSEFKEQKIDYSIYSFELRLKEEDKSFGSFSYVEQWWKPKFLENNTVKKYIIKTDINLDICIDNNILESKDAEIYLMPVETNEYRTLESIEYFPPGTEKLNETDMPSWAKQLDEGKICIKESHPLKKVFEISGREIEGIFEATRENENADFWQFKKIE
jgi:hypothetical protein